MRIDLAGGWTDVPPFPAAVGGAVLSVSIALHASATLSLHTGPGVTLRSSAYDRPVNAGRADELTYDGSLDLLKAAARRLPLDCGYELAVHSGAPPGSGCGSSGAVAVALVAVFDAAQGGGRSREAIAELARDLETAELGNAAGRQDQYAAAFGSINCMRFGTNQVIVEPVNLDADLTAELEHRLLLCYSGQSRLSGTILDSVVARYQMGERQTLEALETLAKLAPAMRQALTIGDLEAVGRYLAENWRQQRRLDPSVTNEKVDAMVVAAQKAGAIGGKALGAGGGGCLVFICRAETEHGVARTLQACGAELLQWRVAPKGVRVWERR